MERKVRRLTISEVRAGLSSLDESFATEGELIVTRRGRPIARILPVSDAKEPASVDREVVPSISRRRTVSTASLRAGQPLSKIPSEVLIREDRDRS